MKTPNLEWADAVFDPWIGCTKVSSGCAMCYAETQQVGKVKWGKGASRERTSKKEWNKPVAWNQAAWMFGSRMRVFCGSLCDVFDEEVDESWRDDLWQLIESTPNLDWLLITKRPVEMLEYINDSGLLDNIWPGVSIENQKTANERIPLLIKISATIRFVNVRPLLGSLSLKPWLHEIDWVMVGGEMGPGARQTNVEWMRAIRDECASTNIPFFVKSWTGTVKNPSRELDGVIHRAVPGREWLH